MKKYILTSLFFLIVSSAAMQGQAALLVLIFGDKVATENFNFSLKLGGTYSIIHGYEEGQNAMSLNFGLVNNIKLTEKLIPEFLPLSSRGIKDVPLLSTGDPNLDDLLVDVESSDRKMNYIDIPVLLKVKLSKLDAIIDSLGELLIYQSMLNEKRKSIIINLILLKFLKTKKRVL